MINLLKEAKLVRYILGHYLNIRKNKNTLNSVASYYTSNKQNDERLQFEFRNAHSQLFERLNNISSIGADVYKFKDLHKGESCFIIGNGPSLNKMDLKLLDSVKTIGMNKIYFMFDRIKLDLDYYVSVNPLVIEQSKKEIEDLIQCPCFVSKKPAERYLSQKEHIYKITASNHWGFYEDINNGCSEGYTVTFVALQIAYYLGFENVFLIGVDHNFNQKGKPNEKQVMEENDSNHFDPRYFKGQEWHLADLEASELSYRMAKLAFERNGRNIYDATLGGKLDIFPKVTFEKALEMANRG